MAIGLREISQHSAGAPDWSYLKIELSEENWRISAIGTPVAFTASIEARRGTDEEKGRSMQAQTASYEANDFQPNEPDKLFGVCQAIGEDFGFNPFFLRLAMLGAMFFSLPGMVVAYGALGVTVALSRWLFPRAKTEIGEAVTNLEPELAIDPVARERELIAA